jgi:CheY-like chemotaxis protein
MVSGRQSGSVPEPGYPFGSDGGGDGGIQFFVRGAGVPSPSERAKSVLVVDDEWDMADALAELLWEEGYATRSVYDGLEALFAVDRERPDLALVDLRIPLHDGVKVAHRLRELGIPVIVMSALDRPRRLCPDVPFVAKPLDVTDLFRLVADHVGPDARDD